MSNTKVSVIVPVYNASLFLDRCVTSIQTQTYTELEIILVDDGSKDNSFELCTQFAQQDTRIRVIQQDNGGPQAAIQTGLAVACGEYTVFVDSDDAVESGMIQALLDTATQTGADLVQCNVCSVVNNTRADWVLKDCTYTRDQITEQIIPEIFSTLHSSAIESFRWAKLFKTNLVRQAADQVPSALCRAEDTLTVLAYLFVCDKIVTISSVFYFYYYTASSITNAYDARFLFHNALFYNTLQQLADQNGYTVDVQPLRIVSLFYGMLSLLRANISHAQMKTEINHYQSLISDVKHYLSYVPNYGILDKVQLFLLEKKIYSAAILLADIRKWRLKTLRKV